MQSKYIFIFLLLSLMIYKNLFSGEPSLNTVVTVSLPTGDQVTFYGDSDPNVSVLYYMPARLTLRKMKGTTNFNAIIYRGITEINIEKSIQDSYVGKLTGGLVDCILELQGPTKDLEELRVYLKQQYPQYANYRIAQIPLIPGSASITLFHYPIAENAVSNLDNLASEQKNQIRSMNSGGPVSSQFGGVIPIRFRLSEIDALILLETLKNSSSNNAFTAAFDVLYSAKTRVVLPPTTVTIRANERRVYKYVENHFKAKGGFWVWSFSTDIRKIREKLEEDGNLEIDINNLGNLPFEFVQGLADKWVENYVLKEMHQIELDIPKARANAGTPSKSGFFAWASFGTNYARVDIKQTIDKKREFSYSYQGVEVLPVYARAELTGLGPANVVTVDFNQSYFTYTPLAVIPLPVGEMLNELFGSARIAFSIKSNDGSIIKRVANFDYLQRDVYQTWIPLQLNMTKDPNTGALKGQVISDISYNLIYNGNTTNFALKNQKFEHSNWEFDVPSVRLADHLGFLTIELQNPKRLFNSFPNLSNIELVFYPEEGKKEIRYDLSSTKPTASYFYDRRYSETKFVEVQATYRTNSGFITKTSKRPVGTLINRIDIREKDIPDLILLGEK